MQDLKNKTFVGIVKDNNDPQKLGRCRISVMNVFDDIQDSDLPWASPWKDLNGNMFILPDVGKVVSVVFDEGNPYRPEYIYADHYNANLQKKLSELSGANYTSMRAVMFDHKTQIYSNDSDGLKLDYKFNNINIKDGSIDINLKDNFNRLNLGSPIAVQQAILGNNFFEWFDEFVKILSCIGNGPYLASVPTPEFLRCLERYQALKYEKFLSNHVNIVDNNYVTKQERGAEGIIGDNWTSTKSMSGAYEGGTNTVTGSESTGYTPVEGNTTDITEPINGDLTTSSGIYGKLASNTKPADYTKIVPTNNKDIDTILNAMKKRNYVILDRPYEMNIIGIRNTYEGGKYTNAFTDWMYLIFKKDNSTNWEIRKFKCSTMPGYYKGVNLPAGIDFKQLAKIQNNGGMGILKPMQYLNVYQTTHATHGKYWINERALFVRGMQVCYRDKEPGPVVTYRKKNDRVETFVGWWGMLIHCAFKRPGSSSLVYNYSEGCQVLSSPADLDEFFKHIDMHVERYGDGFNYTLMYSKDLQSDPITGT